MARKHIVAAAAALAVGLIVGAALGGVDDEPKSAPPETVTVTSVVTRDVEVEVVPDVCLEALDLADDTMAAAGDIIVSVSEWMVAPVGSFEETAAEARIFAAAEDGEALVDEYRAAADLCRAK